MIEPNGRERAYLTFTLIIISVVIAFQSFGYV